MSLEFNKIAAGVLAAALGAMVIGKVASALVHPSFPAKPAIEVKEDAPVAAVPGAAPAKAPAPTGTDAAAGKLAFDKKCSTCHKAEKGAANAVGPALFGVAGGKKAAVAAFAYSSGMTGKGGDWTDEDMNELLWKPASFVKGTKMAFAGLPNDKERGDVIAYLKSLK